MVFKVLDDASVGHCKKRCLVVNRTCVASATLAKMMGSYLRDYEDAQMEDGFSMDAIPKQSKKMHPVVIVDNDHPFDLDAYISNYSGTSAYAHFHSSRVYIFISSIRFVQWIARL
jgi:hypothetical protein